MVIVAGHITADPIDPSRVNIFERRESQAALERNSQDLWIGVPRSSFRPPCC
jgi:hypothetical protein